MADTTTKVVNLLAQTDGRDKIYKFLVNVIKLLAAYAGTKESAKKWTTLAKSLGEGRSLMRMAKWVGNYNKLSALAAKASSLTSRQVVEILRIIGDFGYIFGDNVSYLSKYGVLPFNATSAAKNSKIFQFWGYFFAVILDIWSIITLNGKKARGGIDEAQFKKESTDLYLSVTKNSADFLSTLDAVGYAKACYNPGSKVVACFGATSGAIATYQNWKKLSK